MTAHPLLTLAVLAMMPQAAWAQSAPRDVSTIAFANANVIPMDRERILKRQTLLVRDGRIAAVGPEGSIAIPPGATVIDARDHYLVPGLADMHVHLGKDVGARTDFGDAPLFLANGVTTVLNLRGDPEHLVWRERILRGEILAPTLLHLGGLPQ